MVRCGLSVRLTASQYPESHTTPDRFFDWRIIMKTAKKQIIGGFTVSKKTKKIIEKVVYRALKELSPSGLAFLYFMARMAEIRKKRTPTQEDLAFLNMVEKGCAKN